LDVIWFSNPFRHEHNSLFARILAQDDTPKASSNIHLCSGIMLFPNENRSLQILNSLFEKQLTSNMNGSLIPDEPILNQWYADVKQFDPKLTVLDSKRYVIGHRFFHSLLWRSAQREQIVCFHVNYVVGEKRKARRARAILCRREGDWRWIHYSAVELFLTFFSKHLRN
jgi:Nucleotide-diphospho-sugar transferase